METLNLNSFQAMGQEELKEVNGGFLFALFSFLFYQVIERDFIAQKGTRAFCAVL